MLEAAQPRTMSGTTLNRKNPHIFWIFFSGLITALQQGTVVHYLVQIRTCQHMLSQIRKDGLMMSHAHVSRYSVDSWEWGLKQNGMLSVFLGAVSLACWTLC